jgi:hypothetical protein
LRTSYICPGMGVYMYPSNESVTEIGMNLFPFGHHRSIDRWWSTVTVTFVCPPEAIKFPPMTSLLNTQRHIFESVYRRNNCLGMDRQHDIFWLSVYSFLNCT